MIVAVGDTVENENKLMMLNETGYFLWENMQEFVTLDELISKAESEFDEGKEILKEQIQEFVVLLLGKGILKERESL
ncbi:hypothetical protein P261_00910 [Lachnospiraceae bacterium TWA4]|nr:hypothetical protein P261_00910 [Lachnospiraceae bacterium TWA4]